MMKYLKQFNLLIPLATLLPIFTILPDGAIATPRNQPRSCLNNRIVDNNGIVREDYQVGNFVLSDGKGSPINVRENRLFST